MKSNKSKRFYSFIICLAMLCMISTHSLANETDEGNYTEIGISATAGQHGCRVYNAETGVETIISHSEITPSAISAIQQSTPTVEETTDDSHQQPRAVGELTLVTGQPMGVKASTCLIGARFGDTVIQGTGWLINNQYVMTAGHMLYRADYGYADHIAVFVGPSGSRNTAKQYRLGHWYALGGDYYDNAINVDGSETGWDYPYSNNGVYDDWGIVRLDSALTVSVQYLGRYVVNSSTDMNGLYYTQGYPATYGLNPSRVWSDRYMYSESGQILSSQEHSRYLPLATSNMVVYSGQSGSPIYSSRSSYGYTAEGILVSSGTSSNRSYIILYNDWLNSYVNENCT